MGSCRAEHGSVGTCRGEDVSVTHCCDEGGFVSLGGIGMCRDKGGSTGLSERGLMLGTGLF